MRTSFLSTRWFHLVVISAGVVFLAVDAFHGNIWFDESYSVAIAGQSYSEIWRIGAYDVHPVLYYWMLHTVEGLLGFESILAYRLFTLMGTVALALLGFTHIRRWFGPRIGVLYSFLCLFMPYLADLAVDIRMYSWAMFFVMLCALYAYKIFAAKRTLWIGPQSALFRGEGMARMRASWRTPPAASAAERGNAAAVAGAAAGSGHGNAAAVADAAEPGNAAAVADAAVSQSPLQPVPGATWLIFALAGIAGIYSHYFSLMCVFSIDLMLGIYLIRHRETRRRDFRLMVLVGIVQVLVFVPWIMAFLSQMSVVDNGFWCRANWPYTAIEWFTYPIITSQISFAMRGDYGLLWQVIVIALMVLSVVLAVGVVRDFLRRRRWVNANRALLGVSNQADMKRRDARLSKSASVRTERFLLARLILSDPYNAPLVAAAGVYMGMILISTVASLLMWDMMLYYRYISLGLGPLLFMFAALVMRIDDHRLTAGIIAVILAFGLCHQSLSVGDDYNPKNREPIEYLKENMLQGDLVLSSDIGVEGVTAVEFKNVPQYYLNWQYGKWGSAYDSYRPTIRDISSWGEELSDYEGRFIVIGQTGNASTPRSITDIDAYSDVVKLDQKTFYRPYERTFYTIAIFEREVSD